MRTQTLLLALPILLLTGCLAEKGFQQGGRGPAMAYDVNKYPLNKIVCDGMNEGSQNPGLYGGLKADLYYRTADQPRWYSTADYISKGKKSDQYFFFSHLNVPTRLFSLGFPLETGGVVKDDDGNELIEYFALRFSTILKLGPNDPEGVYEFALLSDDGAVLRIRDENGQYKTVVDSDGDHSTRLGCGTEKYTMTDDTELVVQLDYYQGPRTEIALIPLWRRVDKKTPKETQCGVTGQRVWFDYLDNSKPTSKWHDLLKRGWRPIAKENFEIPNYISFNPCVEGVTPIIENLAIDSDDGRIVVTWWTNIPATAQIKIVNLQTGEEVLTESDNILRRSHEVYYFNVSRGTYRVQAVSISDTYGKAVSDEIAVLVR